MTTSTPTRPKESASESTDSPEGPTLLTTITSWPVGTIAAIVLVGIVAVIGAVLIPRGPITTIEALVSLSFAFLVGIAAGFGMNSRWSLLVAPALFMLIFELGRINVVGPTVDAINLTGLYGQIAFVLGRGLIALLILGPMGLGTSVGVSLARRLNQGTFDMGVLGWTIVSLGVAGLLVLGWFIARPATTAPILGADGAPLPGSIAELTTVEFGGHDNALMIRGRDVESPVLLYLTGGPGGTDFGAMRRDTSLEQDFVVVTWDQRGAGKSYGSLDPTETFTVDQLIADTISITNYLRDRFDEPKIHLTGQSWGSTLGILAAREAPELYHSFVGVGQMVSQRETDEIFWQDSLDWARGTGNEALAAKLQANGPPPYQDVTLYDPVVSYEHDWNPYPEFDSDNEMPAILFVPEYTFMDRVNAFRGFLDTNATLYPQLQSLDFRVDVPELEIPFYMVIGEHEARGRAELAEEWFAMVDAPIKERIVFKGAGHRANFDRPAEFAQLMRDVVARAPVD